MADTPLLTYDDFSALLGDRFEVVVDGEAALALTLTEATPGAEPPPGLRRPFSLVFTGPLAPTIGQGTFAVRHQSLGDLAIFLVPIGPGPEGARYQAVFG